MLDISKRLVIVFYFLYNYFGDNMNINDLASYCLSCKNKPCMKGCPLNNDITSFIKYIKEDNYKEAYNTLIETTYLSSICGRICPHKSQCEGSCIRGIKGDAVRIGELETFIGDMALDNNWEIPISKETNKKVAIIGSGPSSISCAYHLRRNGIKVTIYEKYDKLGGIIRHSIPDFRLDKRYLDKTIDRLIKMGVEVKYNMALGENLFLDDLDDYDAIYLGIGANKSKRLNIPGDNLAIPGNELLEYKLNYDFDNKKIVVYGGGNVAMDVARTLKRHKNTSVTVIYRRSEELMPADKKEVNEAKNEGIEFIFQTNILKISEKDIEVIKTELICDGNNRPKPVNIPDTNYHIDSDYVISCIGSEPDNIIKSLGLELDEWNYIKVDENCRTSNKKIFAGGDIANCKQTIAFAASSGIKAANSIINEIKD